MLALDVLGRHAVSTNRANSAHVAPLQKPLLILGNGGHRYHHHHHHQSHHNQSPPTSQGPSSTQVLHIQTDPGAASNNRIMHPLRKCSSLVLTRVFLLVFNRCIAIDDLEEVLSGKYSRGW